jgi:hypothetical protein
LDSDEEHVLNWKGEAVRRGDIDSYINWDPMDEFDQANTPGPSSGSSDVALRMMVVLKLPIRKRSN